MLHYKVVIIMVDEKLIISQKKELDSYGDTILSIKNHISLYRDDLNCAWQSADKTGIDDALDRLLYRLNDIAGKMQELGIDFLKVYQEKKNEEGNV